MSAKAATLSKPQSRLQKSVASSPRAAKARAAAAKPDQPALVDAPSRTPPRAPAAPASVPETSVKVFALRELRRAPENVRRVRIDEDVDGLAADIAAHGLLQSLIGYRVPAHEGEPLSFTYVVGGGRRLAALHKLCDDGLLALEYQVPVLIRGIDEAVELSLSENLARRDMSPVDEFFAFDELMKRGTWDSATLAKRFGFTKRYVDQRLRLAALVPDILDALRDRKIGLDSAMAYAASSDRELQAAVFKVQQKSTWDQHKPVKVTAAYDAAQAHTGSVLYRYVGADAYEAAGGGYEDDLFGKETTNYGGHRKLNAGHLLIELGKTRIDEQVLALEPALRADYPTLAGVVIPPNCRIGGYPWKAPTPPRGCVMIDAGYSSNQAELWKNAKEAEVPITAIVGLNDSGKLATLRDKFFVPKAFERQVKPEPKRSAGYTPPSPEEVARREREAAIEQRAWRLGVGSLAGTPLEGRAFWPEGSRWIDAVAESRDPRHQGGRLVAIQVFVPDDVFEAQRAEAARLVDEAAVQKALAKKDKARILAMDPPPAIIVVGDQPWFFDRATGWQDEPLDTVEENIVRYRRLEDLLASQARPGELIEAYETTEAFAAATEHGAA